MPVAASVIQNYLDVVSPAPLPVKGADREALLKFIKKFAGDFEFKTEPRDVQLEGLAFSLANKKSMLFFEMRVGKTYIALNWIDILRKTGEIKKPTLVIAHSPLALGIWTNEAIKHSRITLTSVSSGPKALENLRKATETSDSVVVSWSTLQSVFSEKREKNTRLYPNPELITEASKWFDAVVIDEIHMAMHHDTLRFKIASRLVERCQWRLGLTGTPFGRNPFGLWSQYFLIDGGQRLTQNYYFFEQAFGKKKPNRFIRVGYEYVFAKQKMPQLQNKIRDITLSCRLTDVHDVNIMRGLVELGLSKEQQNAYDEIVDEISQQKYGNSDEVKNRFVVLRQISSGFRKAAEGSNKYIDFLDAAKFNWAEEFFENLGDEIKCVFFHEFIHTGERLGYLLDRLKIKYTRLWGGSRDKEAYRTEFQNGDSKILVVNSATGGVGADFSAADYLCFFECPPSVITRRQAEARPLGRGSRPLVVDDIISSPVEQRILDLQKQGSEMASLFRGSGKDIAAALRR